MKIAVNFQHPLIGFKLIVDRYDPLYVVMGSYNRNVTEQLVQVNLQLAERPLRLYDKFIQVLVEHEPEYAKRVNNLIQRLQAQMRGLLTDDCSMFSEIDFACLVVVSVYADNPFLRFEVDPLSNIELVQLYAYSDFDDKQPVITWRLKFNPEQSYRLVWNESYYIYDRKITAQTIQHYAQKLYGEYACLTRKKNEIRGLITSTYIRIFNEVNQVILRVLDSFRASIYGEDNGTVKCSCSSELPSD